LILPKYRAMSTSIKGRGAQRRFHSRFLDQEHTPLDEYLNYCEAEGEQADPNKTNYIPVFPKSFVNPVPSPDVGMDYSANPYQGCEHGCVYCYARNSHQYWGFGPGVDFERNILLKKNAPQLLEQFIRRRNWEGNTIVFSGNTDCYQPIERKEQITRKCLEVLHRWRHPTGIITKNSLILRDLDLLKDMAKDNTIAVHISITSLSEETRRLLEPRTTSIKQRLKAVEVLSENGIPVNVMMAPIIPGLNSHEILPLVKEVAARGASSVVHTVVRLNGQIGPIFEDWARKTLPDKADKMLNQIAACHGEQLSDSRWRLRMRGTGPMAEQLAATMKLAKRKFMEGREMPKLDPSAFLQLKDPQLSLF